MPERIDVYTQHGTRTGRTISAGEKLGPGEYYLHAIVILRGRDGKYLLQQRSLRARYYPGQWDVTGGGVNAGEDSLTAGIREVHEELGLSFAPEQLVFGGRIPLGEKGILDMWGASGDFAEADCAICKDEVEGVKLVDYDTFRSTISYNKDALFMALVDSLHTGFGE